MALIPRTTDPAPISFASSQRFQGNDGAWSTFQIRVGTPEQIFNVLISTTGQETWLPAPEGCQASDAKLCSDLRGIMQFQDKTSTGFQMNASSTWRLRNESWYDLGLGSELNYTGVGRYGFDKVGLQLPGSGGVELPNQVIAGMMSQSYYLGVFGIGPKPTNFTDFSHPVPSFLGTLRNQSMIPSLSWGYTAGASYRMKMATGSLTFGGYDASRFTANNMSFTFSENDSRPLTVALQAVQANNTLQENVSPLTSGILALIDSTVPEIWLPPSSCSIFESAFGLKYDPSTDRYLINDTIHDRLTSLNPTVSFTLGNEISGGQTTTIVLPYKAFDLQASWPIYVNTTRYFPLRRTANDTLYTLGRTFLQEAYIVADYERKNFSVSQCVFKENNPQQIIAIQSTATPVAKKSGLSHTALIAIIVVAIAVSLILGTITALFVRIKRRKSKLENELIRKRNMDSDAPEAMAGHVIGVHEMEDEKSLPKEMEAEGRRYEMAGGEMRHELVTLETPVELEVSPVELPTTGSEK